MRMRLLSVVLVVPFVCTCMSEAQNPYFPSIHQTSPGAKVVPFSAEVVTEHTRVLADGNHLTQKTHAMQYRDSSGRTRTESELDAGTGTGKRMIMIFDPVQETFMTLDPEKKTAFVFGGKNESGQSRGSTNNDVPEKTKPTEASTAEKTDPSDDGTCGPDLEDGNLGTKVIEGFVVTGTRRTTTIEAGKLGDEKPIVTVAESWHSSELGEDLLSINDNPMLGKTTTTYLNIQRGEPDPQLFQVPPDYEVKDPLKELNTLVKAGGTK
jgi:hypothetical protein